MIAGAGRARRVLWQSAVAFVDDGCPKLAAAIAYYALFALFPLVILVIAAGGAVLRDHSLRDDVIREVLGWLPLRADRGRAELEEILQSVTEGWAALGTIGLAGLLLSASGLMGALRYALNIVFGVRDRRGPLRGKALDVLMVLATGLLIGASLAAALATSVLPAGADRLLGAVVGAGVFTALYRYVPSCEVPMPAALVGGLVATAGFEAVRSGFAFYLERVADLDAVYASLTTVVAFLLFVWVSSNVFLFGGEVTQSLATRP